MADVFDDIHAQATGNDSDLGFASAPPPDDDADLGFSTVSKAPRAVAAQRPQPAPSPGIDYRNPAGAVGPLPGVPIPTVNMQPAPGIAHTIVNAIGNADSAGTIPGRSVTLAGPNGKSVTVSMPNYGQNALPDVAQGGRELLTPGQRTKGATDVLRGVNEGLSSSILPVGVAPAELATGVAGSAAGSYAAPKVVKELGGNQQQQDLARQAGAALPLAAGVGASLLGGTVGGELPLAPRAPSAEDLPQLTAGSPPRPPVEIPQEPLSLPEQASSSELGPQAPPPLNEAEARTRIVPTQAAPSPVPAPARGMTIDAQGNLIPAPAGLLPGRAPSAADAAQALDLSSYAQSHPSGRVTGIDQQTGLPIVDRSQPSAPVASEMPEPVGSTDPESGRVVTQPTDSAPINQTLATSAMPEPVGSTDPESGRVVTQPTDSAPINQTLATSAMPAYRSSLQSAIRDISGADLVATRAEKNPSRLAEKITEDGQPPETVNDYGAAQIAVDSPQARDAVIAAVQQQFPVVRVQDNFADGDPEYGYRSYSMQLQMPNGSSQELQIVPREVHDANAAEHKDYKEAREVQLEGGNADSLVASARAKNDAAMARFNARNGISGSIQKGSAVTLPDGTTGTVSFIHPGMKIARVTTDDGRSVTVRNNELQPLRKPSGGSSGLSNIDEARRRSPEENMQRVSHDVIPARGNHAPIIRANDDAMAFLEREQAFGGQRVNAALMPAIGANRLEGELRRVGAARNLPQLTALADSIRANRGRSGGVIISRGSPTQDRADRIHLEEHWHDWQLFRPSAHRAGVEQARLVHHEAWSRAASHLRAAGYTSRQVPYEIPAKIASGNGDETGLTVPEQKKIMSAYLRGARSNGGENIMNGLPDSVILPNQERANGESAARQQTLSGPRERLGQSGSAGSLRAGPGSELPEAEGRESIARRGEEDDSGGILANLADPVREYVRRESKLIRASREIHSGLEELDPQYDADVLRANRILQSLPGTPADQEQVYHHLEDPSISLTKAQGDILARLRPLESESAEIFHKLYPDRQYAQNYVHRIAQQKGSLLDRILGGSKSTGKGNPLKKNAAAGKKRSMMALESPNGKRQVVSVGRGRVTAWRQGLPIDIGPLRAGMTNPEEILDERLGPLEREEAKLKTEQRLLNATQSRQAAAGRRLQNITNRLQGIEAERSSIEHQHIADNLPDKVWRDKEGNPWTFKQATTKEVERETPVEYYKNAAASVVTNWLELRKAERAYDYLEDLKGSPEFQRLAIKPSNPGQIPEGWKSTQLPQFTGYYFEPHVAEVFDQYAKDLAKGEPNVLEKVSSFLTTSIFLNPLAHVPNLTANWLAEKGISPLNVMRWGPEFKAGLRAFNAVVHQNHDFLEALDSGAPLQSQKREVSQFSQILIKKLQKEAEEPSTAEKLQRALGDVVNVPALLEMVVNWMSSKITWPIHDLYFLQSAFLKMAREGMTLPQALKDTGTYIPDERLPTRVLNSKALGDLLRSPALMFTHYHYGVLKGWGKIIHNLYGLGFDEVGTNARGAPVNAAGHTRAAEIKRALSIAAGLAIMLTVIYPEIDKLLAKATGNKDARLHRAGLATVGDAAMRVRNGEESPLQAARTFVTPSVLGETAADLATNRDVLYSGRKIYNEHGTGKEIAEQVGSRVAESVSPAQLAMRASESPESFKQALYSLIGVSFPRHGALRLAAQLRADHIPDDAETPGERKKSIMRSQARYLAWQGDMSGVRAARQSGLFTDKEMNRLLLETKQDPLLYEAKGLGIKDLLTLYESRGTTAEDRQKLVPLITHKAPGISKLPFAERDDLRKRLQKAVGDGEAQR